MNIDVIEKAQKNTDEDIKITCASDIVRLKDVQEIRNAVREHLLFIGLDNRNNIRNITLLGIGSTCNVIIDTKEIIRTALFSASDKVILVHNHPSNNLEPSKDDLHLTNVTKEMLKVFNIKLQDHIIVTDKEYVSMEKTKKIGEEKLENLEKGLLIEENQKLKRQIQDMQKDKKEFNVISAEYVGGYNNTIVYNVEISLNGKKEYVTLERKFEDMTATEKWDVYSNLALQNKEIDYIIQVVSKNPPTMSMDAPPTIYTTTSIEEIEMGG